MVTTNLNYKSFNKFNTSHLNDELENAEVTKLFGSHPCLGFDVVGERIIAII